MNRIGYKVIRPRRRIQPVAGIRRKIRAGFVMLGFLLLFAAVISAVEFSRLDRTTERLLAISVRDLELSRNLFDALDRQHAALTGAPEAADSLFRAAERAFDEAFGEAEARGVYPARLQRIAEAKKIYDNTLIDTLGGRGTAWQPAWYELAIDVKDFMIDSQNTVDRNLNSVQSNAYRALIPGVITLAVAILIIFVFYVLIDQYYIRPVLKVQQGVDGYLNRKIPYKVTVEGRDEVKRLADDVSILIARGRKNETNP